MDWFVDSPCGQIDGVPTKGKEAQEGSQENADNEVAIVVHCKQHDEIGQSECNHMQQCTKGLLDKGEVDSVGRAHSHVCPMTHERCGASSDIGGVFVGLDGLGGIISRASLFTTLGGMSMSSGLLDEVSLIDTTESTKHLQSDNKTDDTDTRSCKHGPGSDSPGGGDEA